MSHKLLKLFLPIILACGSSAAFAQSAASYKPLTSSDQPYIQHTGFAVYNTDSVNGHSITADYAVVTTPSQFVSLTWNFTASAYNNGGTFSCTAYAILLSGTFPTTIGMTQSNTSTALLQLPFHVTVTTPGKYAVSTLCVLPPSNGSGNATLFGTAP